MSSVSSNLRTKHLGLRRTSPWLGQNPNSFPNIQNGILPYKHRHQNRRGHDHYLVCGILGSLTDHSKIFFSGWNWTPTNGYLFAYKDIEMKTLQGGVAKAVQCHFLSIFEKKKNAFLTSMVEMYFNPCMSQFTDKGFQNLSIPYLFPLNIERFPVFCALLKYCVD